MSQITTITSKTTNVHGEEMIVTTGTLGGWLGWVAWEGMGWIHISAEGKPRNGWFSIGQNCPLIQIGIRVICLDLYYTLQYS